MFLFNFFHLFNATTEMAAPFLFFFVKLPVSEISSHDVECLFFFEQSSERTKNVVALVLLFIALVVIFMFC